MLAANMDFNPENVAPLGLNLSVSAPFNLIIYDLLRTHFITGNQSICT